MCMVRRRGRLAVDVTANPYQTPMSDFRPWLAMATMTTMSQPLGEPVELYALLASDAVLMVSGPDVTSLSLYPRDHLALGPVTFGGMVLMADGPGVRAVCVDHSGAQGVWELAPGGPTPVGATPVDATATELLCGLLEGIEVNVGMSELAARLLLWGWMARSRQLGRLDAERVVGAFATAELSALALMCGRDLPDPVTTDAIRSLALSVGHPPLPIPDRVLNGPEDRQRAYLHAMVPTRWMLADQLRNDFRRPDLAAVVMAAPGRHAEGRAPMA